MTNVDLGVEFAKDIDGLKFKIFEAGAMEVTTEIVFHMLDHPSVLDVSTNMEPEDHFSGWEELIGRIDGLKDIARRPIVTPVEAERLEKAVARLNNDISEYLKQIDGVKDFAIAFDTIGGETEKLIAIASLPFPKLKEFLLDWHKNKGPMKDIKVTLTPSPVNLREAFEKASTSAKPLQETVLPSGLIIPAPGSLAL